MTPAQIKSQQTYRTIGDRLIYVQDISGQKVTFNEVGNVDRFERSLRAFASRIESEAPNQ